MPNASHNHRGMQMWAAAALVSALAILPADAAALPHGYSATFNGQYGPSPSIYRGYNTIRTQTWSGSARFGRAFSAGGQGGYDIVSGHIDWHVSITGECTAEVSGSAPVNTGDHRDVGGLEFLDGGMYQIETYQHHSHPVSAPITCTTQSGSETYNEPIFTEPESWLRAWGRGQPGATLSGSYKLGGSWSWTLTPQRSDSQDDKRLHAVITGDSEVTRVRQVTLSGAKSTPKKAIKSYRWTYALGGGCPARADVADTAGSDIARTKFRALCSIRATLTVRDDSGHADQDTAVVRVTPRTGPLWLTPAPYREGTPWSLELFPARLFGEPSPYASWLAGLYRCANGRNWFSFCHNPRESFISEYTLDRIDHGPFKGWSYVSSSTISAEHVGFINPTLGPDARVIGNRPNWYRLNVALAPETTARFLAEVRGHEGAGFGAPHTGHHGALLEALRHNDGALDPRRYLEAQFGPDQGKLTNRAEKCLYNLDTAILLYGLDPLNPPPDPVSHIYMWSERIGVWVLLPLSSPFRQGPPPPLPQLPNECRSH